MEAKLRERLEQIRLFLCDVDGILTEAEVWMGAVDELKRFHIQDGLGLRLLQREGIQVGWISNRPSFATAARANDLKIDFLEQAHDGNKVAGVERLLAKVGLTWKQVSYMGDDIVDLGVLKRAGFAATVPGAIEEAKAMSHYVTEKRGGHGAVREVVEMILKAQGRWDKLVAEFSQ
ncbi:MAG: KdsC family phosphatase [Verrucomicrobiota bacterium]|jgi:3-deoxy-D-manno-octulosonate 8-phosphate phosphatase (KDO 8-P phosphatase)